MESRADRVRRLALILLREAWPLLMITAFVSLILRNVAATNWREIFLYNGDSITLPLLLQSIGRGEPFEWVFSTQTFLFPEFPLYWLCSLVAHTPQSALILNAFVNVFLLYLLLRGLAATFAPRRPLRQIAIALGAVLVLLAAILSERSTFIMYPGVVAPSNIPTLFLLTTYYYGVILLGVAGVLFTVVVTRHFSHDSATRRRIFACLAVIVPVGAVTTYSNPLYAAMFVLPLLVVLAILVAMRRLGWRWFATLVGGHVVAMAIGILLRVVLRRYLGESGIDGYLNTDRAWDAFLQVATVLRDWAVTGWGSVRLLALFGPLALTIAYLVAAAARDRTAPALETSRLFVLLFVLVGAASLVAGQIVTGQHLTRYLVPLFVFPLMGLVVVIIALAEQPRVSRLLAALHGRPVVAIGAAGLAGAVALSAYSVPSVLDMGTERYPAAACLDEWLAGNDASGVATFMTARPLELYGDHSGRVVQTVNTVEPNLWMTNRWYYRHDEFSFVLTTTESEFREAIDMLGQPADITTCPSFDILDFAGTDGAEILNTELQYYYDRSVTRQED